MHDLRREPWRALSEDERDEFLRSDLFGAAILLRRRATTLGYRVVRSFIVLPSTRTPWLVIGADRESVRRFWYDVAAAPPTLTRGVWLADLCLSVARRLPWRVLGLLAPGRVVSVRSVPADPVLPNPRSHTRPLAAATALPGALTPRAPGDGSAAS